MNPCPHCGAVPTGEMLLGYPVVVHEAGCPLCPKLDEKALKVAFKEASVAIPRFACRFCWCVGDAEKELQHALDCPANPLTN